MITRIFKHDTDTLIAAEIDGGEGGIWWWDPTTDEHGEFDEIGEGWTELVSRANDEYNLIRDGWI